MFCKNCGSKIPEGAYICTNCGTQVKVGAEDSGNIGWGALGCCLPLVGLVLFLVWKDTKPQTAKVAGIGALVGFILGIIGGILV